MLASTSWIERPAAGHHVGDYEILPGDRVIGEGRFGVVYAGRRTESSQIMRGGAAGFGPGRDVAIKLVRSGGRYEGIGMQAVREIKLLQEIRCRPHPNVVQVRLRVLSRAGHDAGAEHLHAAVPLAPPSVHTLPDCARTRSLLLLSPRHCHDPTPLSLPPPRSAALG